MRIIWDKGEATANEVIADLPKYIEWHPKTVKTLINRLVQKGVLDHTKKGREFVYYPLVSRETTLQTTADAFLKRVFNGNVVELISHFVERKKLSPKELQEVKQVLESRGAGAGSKAGATAAPKAASTAGARATTPAKAKKAR